MRLILIAQVISFLLISCEESPQTKFDKNGLSFTCPKGWSITDEENIEDQGYYLTVEKDGFDASGLVTLSWMNDSIDLAYYLEIYQSQFKDNIIFRNTNIRFDPPHQNGFNQFSSLASNYYVSILGIEHAGIIHVFYANNKTIALVKQEALENRTENKAGFEIIESSFSVANPDSLQTEIQ